MKSCIIILLLVCVLFEGSAQVTNHVYIQSSHYADRIGTLDVIAFDRDGLYRQYQWNIPSQLLHLRNFGSYHVSNDIILCQPSYSDTATFEYIVSHKNQQNVLFRNVKVYNLDGTVSEVRIRGQPLKELGRKQYRRWKAARKKY